MAKSKEVDLSGLAVVITGASSGIGRAAARMFAESGASVLAVARSSEGLDDLVRQTQGCRGTVIGSTLDVRDANSMEGLVPKAIQAFGRLDIWVNNAAVTSLAKFWEFPPEEIGRVIDTNVYGYINGTRAAINHFRSQGRGVLINNASLLARVPQPYVTPYVMSKHAIRGLTSSLRQEIELEKLPNIYICAVLPGPIDTPLFQHAGTRVGHPVKAMPPVYDVDKAAAAIVAVAAHPRRETFVGNAARMMAVQHFFAPRLTKRMLGFWTSRLHVQRNASAPQSAGNLFDSLPPYAESGGWTAVGTQRDVVRSG